MNAGFFTEYHGLHEFVVGDIPRRRPPRVPGPPSRLLAMKGAVGPRRPSEVSLLIYGVIQ